MEGISISLESTARFAVIAQHGGLIGMAGLACLYDPSDPGTLFQDAAGLVPVAADGDPVRLIRNKVAESDHLVAPSDAARPTFRSVNGVQWLEFDRTDDYLETTTVGGDNHTAVMAARPLAASGVNESLWSFDAVSRDYQVEAGGADKFYGRVNSSGLGLSGFLNDVVDRLDVDFVEAVRLDLAAGTAAMIVDGMVADQRSEYTTPLHPGQTLRIAANRAATNPCGMRMYAFAVFNRALTGPDLSAVTTWFAAKQGQTI